MENKNNLGRPRGGPEKIKKPKYNEYALRQFYTAFEEMQLRTGTIDLSNEPYMERVRRGLEVFDLPNADPDEMGSALQQWKTLKEKKS